MNIFCDWIYIFITYKNIKIYVKCIAYKNTKRTFPINYKENKKLSLEGIGGAISRMDAGSFDLLIGIHNIRGGIRDVTGSKG